MMYAHPFVARLSAVLLVLCGLCGAVQADGKSWDGADYVSLAGFIKALEQERYTGLIFKRISRDLAKGEVGVLRPLLERYFQGHQVSDAGAPSETYELSRSVEEDVRAALQAGGGTSGQLDVPEFMIEPVVALARRTALEVYGLSETAPVEGVRVPVPEDAVEQVKPKPKARAENTGLYRDAADMVRQDHLQFLVGGDDLTARVRLLAEVLKIARSDNHVVDTASVAAFTDVLVEADVVHPDERHEFVARVLEELGMTQEPPRDLAEVDPEAGPVNPEAPDAETPDTSVREEEATMPPVDVPPSREDTAADDGAADDGAVDDSAANDSNDNGDTPAVSIPPDPPAAGPTVMRPMPAPPVHVESEGAADRKGDLLFVLETGMGASVPVQKGDLSRVNQRIEFDPGVAARFGASVMWLEAIGNAHLSLGLVGVLGETEPDRLTGVAGPGVLPLSGSHSYYGVMPFITVEVPLAERINVRFGGGVGAAHRRLEAFSGGAKVAGADGTSLLAQAGGGVRIELAPCIDTGLDIFATYLGGVSGTGIAGASVRLEDTWDIAAYASVRIAFSDTGQNRSCGLFGP